jgi:hypothetical protein
VSKKRRGRKNKETAAPASGSIGEFLHRPEYIQMYEDEDSDHPFPIHGVITFNEDTNDSNSTVS